MRVCMDLALSEYSQKHHRLCMIAPECETMQNRPVYAKVIYVQTYV